MQGSSTIEITTAPATSKGLITVHGCLKKKLDIAIKKVINTDKYRAT